MVVEVINLCLMVMASAVMAQGKYGSMDKRTYKNNQDVNVAIEKVKAQIMEIQDAGALAKSLAKKIATNKVKKQFKQMAENQYAFGFPDGEYTEYGYFDTDNNRSVGFIPQLGRIVINDWKNGQATIAFPNLKLALSYSFNPETMRQQGQFDIADMFTSKPLLDGQEVEEIDGFMGAENVAYHKDKPLADGETAEKEIVVDGKRYEAILLPGHLLMKNEKEFYYGIYIDGETNTPYLSMSVQLLEFKPCEVDEANFQLPEGYKVVKDVKSLNKLLLKEVKQNKHVMLDPGELPAIFWP